MSYGPNGTGIFGRPIPQPRYTPQQGVQSVYGLYGIPRQQQPVNQQQQNVQNIYGLYGLPTQGMYTPNQSLVRNSMMLGFNNPFQQLGYGAAPTYNKYVPPPPPPPQPAPAAPEPEPYQPAVYT